MTGKPEEKLPSYETLADIGRRVQARVEQLSNFEGVTEQAERFILWATNLGLFQSGHASLDYRFRDAPLVFEFAQRLLKDLEDVLYLIEEGIGLIDSNWSIHRNPSSLSASIEADHGLESPSSRNGISDSDSDDEELFASYRKQPVLQIGLERLESIIDRLYRLSFKIRSPSTRIGFSKASSYQNIDSDTGVDLIDQYAEFDFRHVWEHFRGFTKLSNEELDMHYLIGRLAKANTRRRQQFGQWKNHRLKLGKAVSNKALHSDHTISAQPSGADRLVLTSPNEMDGHYATAIEPSIPSTATRVENTHIELDDTASMTSISTFAEQEDGSNVLDAPIPQLPWESRQKKEIECPYCYILCSKRVMKSKAWKHHVMKDLRPYICTYENCPSADQMYDSIRDWRAHEIQVHGDSPREQCPICEESSDPYHIASHLRRLSTFALPRSTGLESEKDDGGSDNADIDTLSQDSDLLSLGFDTGDLVSGDPPKNQNVSGNPKKLTSKIKLIIQRLRLAAFIKEQTGTYIFHSTLSLDDDAAMRAIHSLCMWGDDSCPISTLSMAGARSLLINGKLDNGDTPLTEACAYGHIHIVKFLVNCGASVNAMGGQYGFPLQAASFHGYADVAEYLISQGANVNNRGGPYGCALSASAVQGHGDCATRLILQGADTNLLTGHIEGVHVMSPLFAAVMSERIDMVQLLLRYNARAIQSDEKFGNALIPSAAAGHLEILSLLIDSGAGVNIRSSLLGTALGISCKEGHLDVIKRLLENGAATYLPADAGYSELTALEIACRDSKAEAVTLLSEWGAVIDVPNNRHVEALTLAANNGNLEILRTLILYKRKEMSAGFDRQELVRRLGAGPVLETLRSTDKKTLASLESMLLDGILKQNK